MTKLIAHNPPRAQLKSSGFMGEPTGSIEITENGVYNVKSYAEADVQVHEPSGTVSISENGEYDVYDYAEADVNVQPTLQSKTVTPTVLQQTIQPDGGFDGLSDVTVSATPLEEKTITPTTQEQMVYPQSPNIGFSSVKVGATAPPPVLITKQITANGTYAAEDDNADGYSEVEVAVPREITKLVDGTITEYVDDEVTSIRNVAFNNCSNLQKIHCNNVKTIGQRVFTNCRSLTDVEFNSAESIGDYCFENVGLNDPSKYPYRFPNVTTLSESSFRNFDNFYGHPTRGCFFPKLTSMAHNSFGNAFRVFVFKSKTAISGNSSFLSFANLYIPQALWSWYINGTNWAAIYASYSNKFHTIEDNLDYLISLGFTREELLSVEE